MVFRIGLCESCPYSGGSWTLAKDISPRLGFCVCNLSPFHHSYFQQARWQATMVVLCRVVYPCSPDHSCLLHPFRAERRTVPAQAHWVWLGQYCWAQYLGYIILHILWKLHHPRLGAPSIMGQEKQGCRHQETSQAHYLYHTHPFVCSHLHWHHPKQHGWRYSPDGSCSDAVACYHHLQHDQKGPRERREPLAIEFQLYSYHHQRGVLCMYLIHTNPSRTRSRCHRTASAYWIHLQGHPYPSADVHLHLPCAEGSQTRIHYLHVDEYNQSTELSRILDQDGFQCPDSRDHLLCRSTDSFVDHQNIQKTISNVYWKNPIPEAGSQGVRKAALQACLLWFAYRITEQGLFYWKAPAILGASR